MDIWFNDTFQHFIVNARYTVAIKTNILQGYIQFRKKNSSYHSKNKAWRGWNNKITPFCSSNSYIATNLPAIIASLHQLKKQKLGNQQTCRSWSRKITYPHSTNGNWSPICDVNLKERRMRRSIQIALPRDAELKFPCFRIRIECFRFSGIKSFYSVLKRVNGLWLLPQIIFLGYSSFYGDFYLHI